MEETEGMYMTLHDARAKEALQKEHFVRSPLASDRQTPFSTQNHGLHQFRRRPTTIISSPPFPLSLTVFSTPGEV